MSPKGEPISSASGSLVVPDHPVIPFIEGDGIGPDIWRATSRVLDAAIERAYAGQRRIEWVEIYAGDKAKERYGDYLPSETVEQIRNHLVAIKGPLTTPVGGGYRSLNVSLRQTLDLYTCIRPVRYFEGVPSPVRHPERLNVVIFRENTEDLYAGIEWEAHSPTCRKLLNYLKDLNGTEIREDSGIGVKPISKTGTHRLVRKAIQYGLERGHKSITLVHKGNIMKYTEGAFRDWGYELAQSEFPSETITESEVWDTYNGKAPDGRLIMKDRIADSMFQQLLTRPMEYDILATPNLNGDYLSDAAIAQVGGLGLAPGANVGDAISVFEPTHGTAPKYAGQDKVNPGAQILSGVMLLEQIGWTEAGNLVLDALQSTILQKTVTYDLERLMDGASRVSCSEFAERIVANIHDAKLPSKGTEKE